MKSLFLTLSLCFTYVALASSEPPKLVKIKKECAHELGLEAHGGRQRQPPKSFKRCMQKCIALKSGMISQDGEVNIKNIKDTLAIKHEDHDQKILKCDDDHKSEEDSCERIAKIFNCIKKSLVHHQAM